jgi:hypothetical protein
LSQFALHRIFFEHIEDVIKILESESDKSLIGSLSSAMTKDRSIANIFMILLRRLETSSEET